jgi:hypothetical protein
MEISVVGRESYNIAKNIDSFLAPLDNKHPAYFRDTTDCLNKIRQVQIPKTSFLVALNMERMSKNIDEMDFW